MSDINFVTVDANTITNELINDFETYTGDILYPGDARRIFLQGFAYVVVNLLSSINTTGRSNLLRYAFGDTLDALGELYGTPRFESQKASTIIRFTLSELQADDVMIAMGTRVTPDGALFFATDVILIIPAGNISGDISATATLSGTAHNNFIPGQINKLVDGNAYVASVSNTNTSSGGSETETDDDYRERIQAAPYSFSTAGPSQAYYYWAKNANVDVEDVSVVSLTAGSITIYVIKTGGVIPDIDDQVLIDVYNACNDKSRRPLTDNVIVAPATAVNTTIEVEYYIDESNASNALALQVDIIAAVNQYQTWQIIKMGRTINPDELRKLMLNAGASRVDVISPTRVELTDDQVAQITSKTVTYKGIGD